MTNPVAAFVVGFLAGVVPAVVVTRVAASQLPLAVAVLHGRTATLFATFLAVCVGAAAVVFGLAARERS